MTVRTPVDAADLVRRFYQDQPEIVELTTADGIYTEIPNKPPVPSLRVYQFDRQTVTKTALHLTAHFLQIDAYALKRSTAVHLGGLAVAFAYDLPGIHDLGVITGIDVRGGDDTPDDPITVAKHRHRFDLTVYAYPLALIGS